MARPTEVGAGAAVTRGCPTTAIPVVLRRYVAIFRVLQRSLNRSRSRYAVQEDRATMVFEEELLIAIEGANARRAARINPHPTQWIRVRYGRNQRVTGVLERNKTTVEKVVDRRR
jgi:hypothetical protein